MHSISALYTDRPIVSLVKATLLGHVLVAYPGEDDLSM
jgi:hypothetical protein